MSGATQKPPAKAPEAGAPAQKPPAAKATEAGAAERIVVSGSDLVVLSKPSPSPGGQAREKPASAPAAPDAAPTEGKRLAAVVAHTYAAAAPGRAQYRGSVAHAVDATYGDVDPHAVVKTTQALINHVYSTQEEAVTGDAEDGVEPVVDGGGEDSARP